MQKEIPVANAKSKKRVLVTGGAGFIGSHFCDRALALGNEVVAFDDLSTGKELFLSAALKNPLFRLVRGDIRNLEELQKTCSEFQPDLIAHFAANADVRHGLERPRRDLDYNTIGTWNVVEAGRLSGCKNLIFSSTGSVYGEPEVFPTPEECPFPVQTSLYAASKLAGEAILSAYALGYQMNVTVFRFVSILGPRYTHGHIFDFVKALRQNPKKLRILGNGLQLKSYLHVDDLMDGLWMVIQNGMQAYQVLNIGHDDALTVNRSVGYILNELKLEPEREYTGGERGWIGDSPRIQLATAKLKAKGWAAERTLEQAVRETVRYLQSEPGLFEENT
jgi:UDP-glucose 4-epimerase